jgi:hypothetical protein
MRVVFSAAVSRTALTPSRSTPISTTISTNHEATIYAASDRDHSPGKLVARRLEHGRLQVFASSGGKMLMFILDTDDFARWSAEVQQPPKDKE